MNVTSASSPDKKRKLVCASDIGSMLIDAATRGDKKLAKAALKLGADVNFTNTATRSVLYQACLNEHESIIKLLIQHNANPNQRCGDGSTPVHVACLVSHVSILGRLIDTGGDLRLHDCDGKTPRDWAMRQSDARKRRRVLGFIDYTRQKALDEPGAGLQVVEIPSGLRSPFGSFDRRSSSPSKGLATPDYRETKTIISIQNLGFGKIRVGSGDQTGGGFGIVPLVPINELRHDDRGLSYCNGPYMVMECMLWNKTPVTVKRLHQIPVTGSSVDLLIRENDYMLRLRHPNILLLMGVCQTEQLEGLVLLYERINFGSFHSLLYHSDELLTLPLIISLFSQLCDALIYMHEKNLIHGLVTTHAIQLVTLNFAKLGNLEYATDRNTSDRDDRWMSYPRDAYAYLAPEVLDRSRPMVQSDIYSLTVVLWEVFHGQEPWSGKTPLNIFEERMQRGRTLAIDEAAIGSDSICNLLESGLSRLAVSRPDCVESFKDWLQGAALQNVRESRPDRDAPCPCCEKGCECSSYNVEAGGAIISPPTSLAFAAITVTAPKVLQSPTPDRHTSFSPGCKVCAPFHQKTFHIRNASPTCGEKIPKSPREGVYNVPARSAAVHSESSTAGPSAFQPSISPVKSKSTEGVGAVVRSKAVSLKAVASQPEQLKPTEEQLLADEDEPLFVQARSNVFSVESTTMAAPGVVHEVADASDTFTTVTVANDRQHSELAAEQHDSESLDATSPRVSKQNGVATDASKGQRQQLCRLLDQFFAEDQQQLQQQTDKPVDTGSNLSSLSADVPTPDPDGAVHPALTFQSRSQQTSRSTLLRKVKMREARRAFFTESSSSLVDNQQPQQSAADDVVYQSSDVSLSNTHDNTSEISIGAESLILDAEGVSVHKVLSLEQLTANDVQSYKELANKPLPPLPKHYIKPFSRTDTAASKTDSLAPTDDHASRDSFPAAPSSEYMNRGTVAPPGQYESRGTMVSSVQHSDSDSEGDDMNLTAGQRHRAMYQPIGFTKRADLWREESQRSSFTVTKMYSGITTTTAVSAATTSKIPGRGTRRSSTDTVEFPGYSSLHPIEPRDPPGTVADTEPPVFTQSRRSRADSTQDSERRSYTSSVPRRDSTVRESSSRGSSVGSRYPPPPASSAYLFSPAPLSSSTTATSYASASPQLMMDPKNTSTPKPTSRDTLTTSQTTSNIVRPALSSMPGEMPSDASSVHQQAASPAAVAPPVSGMVRRGYKPASHCEPSMVVHLPVVMALSNPNPFVTPPLRRHTLTYHGKYAPPAAATSVHSSRAEMTTTRNLTPIASTATEFGGRQQQQQQQRHDVSGYQSRQSMEQLSQSNSNKLDDDATAQDTMAEAMSLSSNLFTVSTNSEQQADREQLAESRHREMVTERSEVYDASSPVDVEDSTANSAKDAAQNATTEWESESDVASAAADEYKLESAVALNAAAELQSKSHGASVAADEYKLESAVAVNAANLLNSMSDMAGLNAAEDSKDLVTEPTHAPQESDRASTVDVVTSSYRVLSMSSSVSVEPSVEYQLLVNEELSELDASADSRHEEQIDFDAPEVPSTRSIAETLVDELIGEIFMSSDGQLPDVSSADGTQPPQLNENKLPTSPSSHLSLSGDAAYIAQAIADEIIELSLQRQVEWTANEAGMYSNVANSESVQTVTSAYKERGSTTGLGQGSVTYLTHNLPHVDEQEHIGGTGGRLLENGKGQSGTDGDAEVEEKQQLEHGIEISSSVASSNRLETIESVHIVSAVRFPEKGLSSVDTSQRSDEMEAAEKDMEKETDDGDEGEYSGEEDWPQVPTEVELLALSSPESSIVNVAKFEGEKEGASVVERSPMMERSPAMVIVLNAMKVGASEKILPLMERVGAQLTEVDSMHRFKSDPILQQRHTDRTAVGQSTVTDTSTLLTGVNWQSLESSGVTSTVRSMPPSDYINRHTTNNKDEDDKPANMTWLFGGSTQLNYLTSAQPALTAGHYVGCCGQSLLLVSSRGDTAEQRSKLFSETEHKAEHAPRRDVITWPSSSRLAAAAMYNDDLIEDVSVDFTEDDAEISEMVDLALQSASVALMHKYSHPTCVHGTSVRPLSATSSLT